MPREQICGFFVNVLFFIEGIKNRPASRKIMPIGCTDLNHNNCTGQSSIIEPGRYFGCQPFENFQALSQISFIYGNVVELPKLFRSSAASGSTGRSSIPFAHGIRPMPGLPKEDLMEISSVFAKSPIV